jgi:hypothetical protein
MEKKVLISCPISNREWILPYYLNHVYNIEYNKKLIDIYWLVNNSKDNSLQFLKDFQKKYEHEYNSITIEIYNKKDMPRDERTTYVRETFTYNWLSELRNKILKKCVKLNCDYLFSCDSDILFPSNVLTKLLSQNKDVIASLIYNGYEYASVNEAYKYPNILNKANGTYLHVCNYYVKNPHECKEDKVIEIDATGAIILISKRVCEKTNYSFHKLGEDIHWSKSVQDEGFKLYCMLNCFSYHIMSERILDLYKNNKL